MSHDLNQYDHSMSNGLTKTQLNQLRELHWIEEGFNLMLSGPSGVGKTYIASGLCSDAIDTKATRLTSGQWMRYLQQSS